MSGIFICYRREDAAGHAGRLFDRLTNHFGSDKIFMDVSGSIEPGADFVDAIEGAVTSSDVLLVMIGRKWLRCTDDSGRRRLDDPGDFIRLEAATAIGRRVRVIPLLVDKTKMPPADELPGDLKPLSRKQALEISDERWDYDVRRLIETLEKLAAPKAPEPAEPRPRKALTWIKRALLAVLVLCAAVLVLWQIQVSREKWAEDDRIGRVTVPRVVGRNQEQAAVTLKTAGLEPGGVSGEPAERYPGTVLRQEPPAGERVERGTRVEMVVAVLPPYVPSEQDEPGREPVDPREAPWHHPAEGEPEGQPRHLDLFALAGDERVKHLRLSGGDHFRLLLVLDEIAPAEFEVELAVEPAEGGRLEVPRWVTVPRGHREHLLEIFTGPVDRPERRLIVARVGGRDAATVEIELIPG